MTSDVVDQLRIHSVDLVLQALEALIDLVESVVDLLETPVHSIKSSFHLGVEPIDARPESGPEPIDPVSKRSQLDEEHGNHP